MMLGESQHFVTLNKSFLYFDPFTGHDISSPSGILNQVRNHSADR